MLLPSFILFELDFDVKFPLLHLLLFLSDLKSTIYLILKQVLKWFSNIIIKLNFCTELFSLQNEKQDMKKLRIMKGNKYKSWAFSVYQTVILFIIT